MARAKPKFMTVDLCDRYRGSLQVALPLFRAYGRSLAFSGTVETVKCFEDNIVIKEVLARPGKGKVLVIDGGASLRYALIGDVIARLAAKNGWAGIVVNGCVRDVDALNKLAIGIRALAHMPLAGEKHGLGIVGVPVSFAGVEFFPGHHLYADGDGIVVSEQPLT